MDWAAIILAVSTLLGAVTTSYVVLMNRRVDKISKDIVVNSNVLEVVKQDVNSTTAKFIAKIDSLQNEVGLLRQNQKPNGVPSATHLSKNSRKRR